MTYRPLREASDGVINGAAFRQCYTVCCTCGPLKVYGQDTKSRTRCQFSSARDGMPLDFRRTLTSAWIETRQAIRASYQALVALSRVRGLKP